MRKTIVLVYNNLVVGGAETLLLRQAKWASKNNEVYLVCNSITRKMKQSFDEVGIEIIITNLKRVNSINKVISELEKSGKEIDKVEFLDYLMYFRFQFIQLIEKTNINAIYYSVLPTNSNFFSHFRKNKAISNLLDKYNHIFCYTNGIMFMDKDCCDGFTKINKIEEINKPNNIVLLPFEKYDAKKTSNEISILSIARADFPFKGYLFGLIDAYKEININNKYNMTIISYGKHIDKLKDKINKSKVNGITLIDETSPEELKKYYSKTKFYVGMGTTILEAANYGIPCILVAPNLYEFVSNETFDQNGQLVARNNGKQGIEVLKKFLELDSYEYSKIQEETKKQLINYDNEKNMKKIFNRKIISMNFNVSLIDSLIFYFVYYINLLLQSINVFINKTIRKYFV